MRLLNVSFDTGGSNYELAWCMPQYKGKHKYECSNLRGVVAD